ncbi:MAG TPA: hypothetical protein PKL77_02480 [Candidatus Omnitrophota bacterium]|nr:hypothetical protein [Candidatus Omnitrophota bacterium]
MLKFSEIITESITWTGTVLFRPFRLKKWIFLALVALFAGQLPGTFNSSNNLSPDRKQAHAQTQGIAPAPATSQTTADRPIIDVLRASKQEFVKYTSDSRFVPLAWGIGLVVAFLVLLMIWISSRFSFIFVDDVVKNDASIRAPFRAYKKAGNSLFGFALITAIISLGISLLFSWGAFTALLKTGVLNQTFTWTFVAQATGIIWPWLLALLVVLCGIILIHFLVYDFVVPVMYTEKVGVCAGWKKVLSIVGGHVFDTVCYAFLKVVLYIASLIVLMFVGFVAFAGLLFQGFIGAIIAFGIYKISPLVLHLPYKIIFIGVAVPVVIVLACAFICLALPIAVFFRTFSIKFLGRLIPEYTFFTLCRQCAAEHPDTAGYCAACSAVRKGEVPVKPYRSPALAAIMSFVVSGFGQIYNGQVAKGLLFFFTSWLVVPWVFGIRDAYKTARKINEGVLITKKRLGCLLAMAIAVAVLALIVLVLAVAASFLIQKR